MEQKHLFEEAKKEIRNKKPRMAICYDFDKTLSPDDMQTFTLIPSFKMSVSEFWSESNQLAKENLMDSNLAWMYQLVQYSKIKRKPLKRDYFNEIGKDVKLYKGVESWFERVNKYAESKGVILEHYIISSGLKEIIEGSPISQYFERIYASTYLYSADNVAEWPAQSINYTNKTQYIFRIAKGIFEEYDERVNDSVSSDKLYIPYENIVYIGDSATDIPCMSLVKSKGGYAIGVYDPERNKKKKVFQLFSDKRIDFFAPANYSARGNLFKYVKMIIENVSIKEKMKTEQEVLNIPASMFKLTCQLETIANEPKLKISKKDRKEMDAMIGEINAVLEAGDE